MTAYYNEIDPYAAQWLRNLIAAGHIAPGDVDERSILDVRPDDLAGYTQCHFFAGIGGWSLALRNAGWPDDRPVWTGSCPCQPFSAAGRGAGASDERHLWPHFHHLIRECRPGVVFGEQVEAAINHGWLDLVQSDLEGEGYAFGAVGMPAAGVGAPHIRQRLWWVAEEGDGRGSARLEPGRLCDADPLAQPDSGQRHGFASGEGRQLNGAQTGRQQGDGFAERGVEDGGMADPVQSGRPERGTGSGDRPATGSGQSGVALGDTNDAGLESGLGNSEFQAQNVPVKRSGSDNGARPTNGFWRDADWLFCRDGKWRPVEPGTFPLAYGVPARVGKLRAYGNAIVPEAAEAFIRAYLG